MTTNSDRKKLEEARTRMLYESSEVAEAMSLLAEWHDEIREPYFSAEFVEAWKKEALRQADFILENTLLLERSEPQPDRLTYEVEWLI